MTTALRLSVSPRAFAGALLAIVAVLGGATWFLSVAPKHDKAATLQKAIQSDQAKLASASHAGKTSSSAKTESTQIGVVDAALPNQLAMPQVVDELDALAKHAGVTLDSVTPAAAVDGTGYVAVPLTVVVDGHFFAVDHFLRLIRTQVSVDKTKISASGRLFDVSGVELNQTEPAPMVTATVQMQAYYYSPGATPVSTDATGASTTTTTGG